MTVRELMKRPSAFLPLLLAAAALLTIGLHLARYGTEPQADEGAAARIWQLLMLAQLGLAGLFAIRWLPKASRPALVVLALQGAALVAAAAPIALLGW